MELLKEMARRERKRALAAEQNSLESRDAVETDSQILARNLKVESDNVCPDCGTAMTVYKLACGKTSPCCLNCRVSWPMLQEGETPEAEIALEDEMAPEIIDAA